MIIVSSCLVGLSCRYDGGDNKVDKVMQYLEGKQWIPVCPEQMGGLTTPRDPAEIVKDRVMTKTGKDVTAQFIKGADEAARLAMLTGADYAIMKSRSPSCGCGKIYDGSFSKIIVEGDGITVKAFKKMGIQVISDEDLE